MGDMIALYKEKDVKVVVFYGLNWGVLSFMCQAYKAGFYGNDIVFINGWLDTEGDRWITTGAPATGCTAAQVRTADR